ncbi:hypothetical protein BV898_08472 [Hypsibius exemplaris]|uniref:G-protein coupled receptors family 1 profile domain-containing protein n=1 Tax=Hypsibius exemplaris TaxID=2072580 RepID=A0A1W0WQE1_HYPEX|nr:hypothetical protein BV898_08472 [Hypsibius exemplaris]
MVVLCNVTANASNASTSEIERNILTTSIFGFLSLTSLFGNGLLAVTFAKTASLRTPFNIYLFSLVLCNLAYLFNVAPLQIFFALYREPGQRWSYGEGICTWRVAGGYLCQGGTLGHHQLIALTRMWAVLFPNSYRLHHSQRTAWICVAAMWGYVMACTVPFVVLDTMYYRQPTLFGRCNSNVGAQPKYAIFILCTSILAVVSMWIAMCLVLHTKKQRRRFRIKFSLYPMKVFPTSTPTTKASPPQIPAPETHTQTTRPSNCIDYGTVLLTLVTLEVTICWTPFFLRSILAAFIPKISLHTAFQHYDFFRVFLYTCEPTLDPILLYLSSPLLREAVKHLLQRRPRLLTQNPRGELLGHCVRCQCIRPQPGLQGSWF